MYSQWLRVLNLFYHLLFVHLHSTLIRSSTNLFFCLFICLAMLLPNLEIDSPKNLTIWIILFLKNFSWISLDDIVLRKRSRFLLLKEWINFKLSPQEMHPLLVFVTSLCPPESSPHDSPYQIGVVSLANKKFIRSSHLFWSYHIQSIAIIYFPQQISIELDFIYITLKIL